ncbi:hypothetical protein AFFFEF_02248 [Methylorubrum extorquens]
MRRMAAVLAMIWSPACARCRSSIRPLLAYRVEADRVRVVNVFYGGRDFEALYRGHAPDGDD